MTHHLPLLKYNPWSPSKADLASRCALAFKYRYVDKKERKRPGAPAKIGTTVHRAQELVLQGETTKTAIDQAVQEDKELTTHEIEESKTFAQSISSFNERIGKFSNKHKVRDLLVECKWAVTPDLEPTDYDSPNVMIRGIIDLALVVEGDYLIVIDHKSGKKKSIKEYENQLNIYTVIGYSHFPEVKGVQTAINFMATDKVVWGKMKSADHIQKILQPWLKEYLNNKALGVEGFQPRVGIHCRWCDYRDICPEIADEDN